MSDAARKLLAVAILVVVAYLLFKIVLGFATGILTIALLVVGVIAVIWALRVL